jgi:hypothetical protein
MNQLQLLSIKTLNSPYKIILNILIYLIIYVCITGKVFYTAECMQENTIPGVAEAKPSIVSRTPVNTKTIMQREISNFLEQSSVIEEQKRIISERENQLAIQEKRYLDQEKRYIELKKGHSHGTLAVGLVALGMISIAALANAVKRN